MEIVLVNESNIRDWVPDLPNEFFRLPYDQVKSDVMRAAVIYHHGGLYLDTDFLVNKPLAPFMRLTESHDIISYAQDEPTTSTKCLEYRFEGAQEKQPHWSSNWHVGKKGNVVSATWWKNIKALLARKCAPGEFKWAGAHTCCHEEGAPEKEKDPCQVPWGHVEWLKIPLVWLRNMPKEVVASDEPLLTMVPDTARFYCLNGRRSLTPEVNGALFWMPWDEGKGETAGGIPPDEWEMPQFRQHCKLDELSGDLACGGRERPDFPPGPHQHIEPKTYDKYFGRPAYHLFSSTHQPIDAHVLTADDVFQGDWVISMMYRKALGVAKRKVPPAPPAASATVHPDCAHIFAWYEYELDKDHSPFVELNIRTWARQNPGMKVVLVNRSNIREWVPDLPEEASKLWNNDDWRDILRVAAVFHHGGVYIDTEYLVLRPLAPFLSPLATYDVVATSDVHDHSTETARTRSKKCLMPNELFSAAWYAGRKGNAFSKTWWANIKTLLTRECPDKDFADSVDRVCCHAPSAPEDKNCHVPWGQLEQLKIPAYWARKHPEDAAAIAQLPPTTTLLCLNGWLTFTPQLYGELLWIPWDSDAGRTRYPLPDELEVPTYQANCTAVSGTNHLSCQDVVKPSGEVIKAVVYKEYFNRPAYRLFLRNGIAPLPKNEKKAPWTITAEDILRKSWLLSELYRRALGVG